MFERRRARIVLAVLTLASLVLLTVDERAGREGALGQVRDGVATVFGPVQDGLASLIRPVGGLFDAASDLLRLREDNARLRAELERLRERRRSFDDVVRENDALRGLLDMESRLAARSDDFELLAAEVIGLAPSNFEWTITIDAGEQDGLVIGMPVVNGDGLVGRIIQVGPRAARVLLAIDPNFSSAAQVARVGEHGLVTGGNEQPMRLQLLDPEVPLEVGDEVVTSSYRNATFPEGIPIGAVSEVGEQHGDLSREVLVRPYVDFTSLEAVLVIVRAPPPEPLPPTSEVPRPDDGPVPSPTPTGPAGLLDEPGPTEGDG